MVEGSRGPVVRAGGSEALRPFGAGSKARTEPTPENTISSVNSLALWAALLCWSAESQTVPDELSPDTESKFEKFEFQIPMRDGVSLYTAVYVPNEASERYPILLYRTRYGVGHYGANDYAPLRDLAWPGFTGPPYILVWQDVRGNFLSEGKFVDMTPHVVRKR